MTQLKDRLMAALKTDGHLELQSKVITVSTDPYLRALVFIMSVLQSLQTY